VLEFRNRLFRGHDFLLKFDDLLFKGFVLKTFLYQLTNKNSLLFLKILDRSLEFAKVLLQLINLFLSAADCSREFNVHILDTLVFVLPLLEFLMFFVYFFLKLFAVILSLSPS